MTAPARHINLQVLICTIGSAGIARVASARLPQVDGVEYIVCWQTPKGDSAVPRALADRADVRVLRHNSVGLCRNRNFALRSASAPLALIGDDDVDYSADGLRALIAAASCRPEAAVLCCRYTSRGAYVKPYPAEPTRFASAPKGYYPTSFEIALRPEAVCRAGVWFNENLGLGAPLLRCGEEDVFVHDAIRARLAVVIVPVTIGAHDHATTGERDAGEPYFVMTHGAVMSHIRPLTWLPRLMIHALRNPMPWWRYMGLALRGVAYARRHCIFRLPPAPPAKC